MNASTSRKVPKQRAKNTYLHILGLKEDVLMVKEE